MANARWAFCVTLSLNLDCLAVKVRFIVMLEGMV